VTHLDRLIRMRHKPCSHQPWECQWKHHRWRDRWEHKEL